MLKSVEEINNELHRNKHGYVVDDTHYTVVNDTDFEVVGSMLDLHDTDLEGKVFVDKDVPLSILNNKPIMDSLKSIVKAHDTVGVSVFLSNGGFHGSELVLSEVIDPPKPVIVNEPHTLIGRQYVYRLVDGINGIMFVCEEFYNMYEK
jgi:hypothetical protein